MLLPWEGENSSVYPENRAETPVSSKLVSFWYSRKMSIDSE